MEIDRFCDAMISIKLEIDSVTEPEDSILRGSPHTAIEIASDVWNHSYTREEAAYPSPSLKNHKFWPPVGRIDNTWGDRNLICSCPDGESYMGDN